MLEVAKMGDSFKIDIFFTPTFGGFTVITNISYSYCQVEKEGRNSQHQNKQEDTEVMRMILWKVGTPNAENKFVVEAEVGGGGYFLATSNMGYGGL